MRIISTEEINRYIHQIQLPEIRLGGQEKIKRASVLVIGAGGLGCPVLQYLTAAGVGTIGIMDNDWVDDSNLHRQILYNVNDLSKPKPVAAKEKLELLNPHVNFIIHFFRLNYKNALEILSGYDIIVDCTDNFPARYLISDSCVILNKPEVYGAVHRFSGQVMVLNYLNGPTLRCLYPKQPPALNISSCNEYGVIGTVTGLIGSLQASEVLKIILGLDNVLSGKLFMIDTLNFSTMISTFNRDPGVSEITELGEYESDTSKRYPIREISASDLKKMLAENPKTKVIDLREDEDKTEIGFKTIVIPHYEISRKVNLISGTAPVVFYCKRGGLSASVINYLREIHKMDNLYSLIL
jgi:sulfur-carrier protein adenylyltransferase/sulfurtransferase